MQLSARNQLRGRITSLKIGTVMAEVTIALSGGDEVISVITRGSVESMSLREGDEVTAVIKSTEILVAK